MITLDTLILPAESIWVDEFSWNRVKAEEMNSVTGRHIVSARATTSSIGRPITLSGEFAWIYRPDILTLRQWCDIADKLMMLTMHDGRSIPVRFRLWEPEVIAVVPVTPTAYPTDATIYALTLKLYKSQ